MPPERDTGRLEHSGPAPWAQEERASRGRRHVETEHPYRSLYARDRDRIIHCRAFRRLEYKTQVFVNHEGDHYRTRLTHSIEVAQIARTVARALGLNEDLTESLALSHDLGHTPFGHLGEEVLGPLMVSHGGFNHNRQGLRIVELLEKRYPDFPGLNLSWEVREGIAKHSGMPALEHFPEASEYRPTENPPLEAQMIDLVDEIAYNHHDIDDGLESGLLDLASLVAEVPIFGTPYEDAAKEWPAENCWMWVKIALRRMIDRMVSDLVSTTRTRLEGLGLRSVDELRAQEGWLVGLSSELARENRCLKEYLRRALYRHPRINATRVFYADVLADLFGAYVSGRAKLPDSFAKRWQNQGLQRSVCDYIAGMTDRFALEEHRRLCGGPGSEISPAVTRS